MRHDDAIIVIVFDVVEETHTVGGREILFRSVEDAGIRIGSLISGGNLRDIGFQTNNHRLVRQVQTLHFMRCNTHYQCFTCSDFMVAYSAILFYHPDAILLRRINALNTPACQSFQIEVGKRLVRTVILRAHETVELAVIHCHEPFLELRRLLFQPFREPVADFVNLGVGELYALAVTHLDVVAVLIFANTFHHVGTGVVQSVFQQVHTVIVPVIALYQKLVRDLHGAVAARHGKLVHAGGIGDFHVRVEKMAHVGGIHARGNPAFTEVEVEVFKGDTLRLGFLQSLQSLFHFRQSFAFQIIFHPCLYTLRLLYHVSRDEAVFNLVTGYERIVEDTPLEGIEKLLFRTVCYPPHIVEIDRTILVERCRQGFFRRTDVGMVLHREGNGTVEDVRFDELAVLRTFQRKDVAPSGVHHHQFHVLFGVEVAITHDKLVVTGVQVFTPRYIFLTSVRFIAVQPLVCVTERYIQQRFLFLITG